jgi:hypothetical protein
MDNSVQFINSKIGSLAENLDKQTPWLSNDNIVNIIIIGLIIYSTLFVGKLWDKGMEMLKHPIVKIILLMLIVYLSKKNVSLAIISAIVFVVILMTNFKNTHEFLTVNQEDEPNDYSDCFCSCDSKNCSCVCDNVQSKNDTYIDIKDEIYQDNQSAFDKITQQFNEHESEIQKTSIQ